MKHKPVHAPIPGLGLRSIKTAFAAALTALIYSFISRNPTFACIGAIFGLGTDFDNSWLNGGNRLIGTLIGGFGGLGLFWFEHQFFTDGNYYFRIILLFLGVIIRVSLSVYLKWPGAIQPGGVVLCIILYNTPPDHMTYALDRMFDTAIGVLVALLINILLPRHRIEQWLSLLSKKQIEAPHDISLSKPE